MKIKFGLLVLIPVFLAGCGHSTRSSGSYLGEITRHPDRYMGATVSVFGTVVSVDHTDNGTRFRIATVNYAYVFDVTYPGSVPKLSHDKDAYLLGKVVGSEKSVEAYSGVIIKLSAIAVRPVGGKAVYRQQDRRIAQQWVKGKLDLSEVQTVASGQEEETEMAAAAPPAPGYTPASAGFAPTPRAAAPSSYPGLEGLAEPVQIAGGAQPVSSTPVHISSEPEMGPPPPPPTQAPVAYAPPPPPAQAPVPNATPAPPLAPPPVAYVPPPAPPQVAYAPPAAPPPVAYAPPPAPPPVASAPPPAQAPVAYAPPPPPVSLDKADAADLRMINGKWNDLPEAAKAEIIRQIVANYKDLTVVSQNWRGLPDQVKAMILKQIIESGP